jgi:peroxiredoxin
VLGVSVDFNGANQAWAGKLGLKYPLLADTRRQVSRAFGVLNDDPALLEDAKRIPGYLRAKRAWFIIDKEGIIRFAQVNAPLDILPNDQLLEVVNKYR